ncbi:MAG: hypothetical protein EOM83_04580 [Clostridia bacterium]|nr:hypothetical protein [Clostridia bacterium]
MDYRTKSLLLWIAAFLLMAAAALYQRTTGPTYPTRGKVSIGGEEIKYKLIRTWEGSTDARITIKIPNQNIVGKYRMKRYKSHDEWSWQPMSREGDLLVARLPGQPAAGKVMYEIYLGQGDQFTNLTEEPLILRYKGHVPLWILIPHIIIIFMAMMFSMHTGFEALIKGKNLVKYSLWTVILLTVGGLFLGPLVQKYAFDVYWAGWPFGQDLTDNKTLAAWIMWVAAYFQVRNNPRRRGWVIAAAVVLLAVYLIPHSMFGSEIDYTQETLQQ